MSPGLLLSTTVSGENSFSKKAPAGMPSNGVKSVFGFGALCAVFMVRTGCVRYGSAMPLAVPEAFALLLRLALAGPRLTPATSIVSPRMTRARPYAAFETFRGFRVNLTRPPHMEFSDARSATSRSVRNFPPYIRIDSRQVLEKLQ